jgi:hypothetical protein
MMYIGMIYLAAESLVLKNSKTGLFKFKGIADGKDLLDQIGHPAKINNYF